jgi:hypothetical protein
VLSHRAMTRVASSNRCGGQRSDRPAGERGHESLF